MADASDCAACELAYNLLYPKRAGTVAMLDKCLPPWRLSFLRDRFCPPAPELPTLRYVTIAPSLMQDDGFDH